MSGDGARRCAGFDESFGARRPVESGPGDSESMATVSQIIEAIQTGRKGLRLVRLPVERPQLAAAFLRERSRGVMDLIAHFWERLSATPPLARGDLHLVAATPADPARENLALAQLSPGAFSGAMLYVPKAHRADVLALDQPTAAAFAAYIGAASPANSAFSLTDFSGAQRGNGNGNGGSDAPAPATADSTAEPHAPNGSNGRAAIDFLTGDAQGVRWMTPLLLPAVHRRSPARELVNAVMQLPVEAECDPDPGVRLARDSDIPVLNRWRRQYKEERGILFDADMDAWVEHQRVFVYETASENPPAGAPVPPADHPPLPAPASTPRTIVAVAKIDLDLQSLVEIGGVYTFPEFRNRGFGGRIVRDLAWRIRQMNKTPTPAGGRTKRRRRCIFMSAPAGGKWADWRGSGSRVNR